MHSCERKSKALWMMACLCLLLWCPSESRAQIPFENGYSLEHYASGMYAPTEMAFDSAGNLFCGSGFEPTWPVGLTPTPIFKVLPDGTTLQFSYPISDPDALTVDSNDDVFVGSWGGVITRIDGVTEAQSNFVTDSRLKNIDGLKFSPSGHLYAVAIDSGKVHKIDPVSRAVTEFADLSSLGITGMSGIAFEPGTERMFVASPLQNVIVELNSDGSIANPSVASGFAFLGFIEFDPSGKNDGYLFAPDASSGEIFKVDMETGQKTLLVDQIFPGPVGVALDSEGVLYFNINYDQIPAGEVYRVWDMVVDLPAGPSLGDPVTIRFESRFDENVPFGTFIALDNLGPFLPDGRQFPLDVTTMHLLVHGTLNGDGEYVIQSAIPMDQSLVGLEIYMAFMTYQPAPFYFLSLSKAAFMEIH